MSQDGEVAHIMRIVPLRMLADHIASSGGICASCFWEHVLLKGCNKGSLWILVVFFIVMINVVNATITGDPPNPLGDTDIDENTTWGGESSIVCGGNVTVGNVSKRINFTITDSNVTVTGKWTMGGDTPVNFSLINSTMTFDVQDGETAHWPSGAVINTTQMIDVKWTGDMSKASRIELRNSTIQGMDVLHRAWGVKIDSGWTGANHTIIADTVTFKHLGGCYTGGGGYALAVGISGPSTVDSASYIKNVTLTECGFGLCISDDEISADYVTSYSGVAAFMGGSDWNHLTMHGTSEGLYTPADGAWIRNGWFNASETKFNIMSASNVVFEYNTVKLAAFNAGDGQYDWNGNNNTVQHNTFIQTGVGGRKIGLKILNNTFDRGMPLGGNLPINIAGSDSLVSSNTITGGGPAIRVSTYYTYSERAENNIVRDNIINASSCGIDIKDQVNGTFINNSVNDIYATFGMKIENSSNLTFRDNSISNTTTYDIHFGASNSNITFINTDFDDNEIGFADAIDVFRNYYYLDVEVLDLGGYPVSGVTVNITNDVNGGYPSINAGGETKTSFVTGADGHTPVSSSATDSAVILDYWQNTSYQENMTYNVTVEKDGQTNFTIVNPDSTWYRTIPNTYQNTTTIIIPVQSTLYYNATSEISITITASGSCIYSRSITSNDVEISGFDIYVKT